MLSSYSTRRSLLDRTLGDATRLMRTMIAITLCFTRLAASGLAGLPELDASSLQFLRHSPRTYIHNNYRVEGDWRDYHFSFTNRSPRSVYYYVHRSDVADIAGQPFHYEQSRRWGR